MGKLFVGSVALCCCAVFDGRSRADTSTVEIDVFAETTRLVISGPPDDPIFDYVVTDDQNSLGIPFDGFQTASLGALTPWALSVGFGAVDLVGPSNLQVSTVHSASASAAPSPSVFVHEGRVLARWQSSSVRFTNADGSPLDGPVEVTLWCTFKSELAEVGVPVCSTRSVQLSLDVSGAVDVSLDGALNYRRSQIFCDPFPSMETITINGTGLFAGGSSTMNKTVTVPVRFVVEPGRDTVSLDLIAETTLFTDSFGTPADVSHLLSLESFVNIGNAVRPAASGGAVEGVFDMPAGVTANSSDGRIADNGYVAPGDPSCGQADLAEPVGVLDFFDVLAYLQLFDAEDASADLVEPLGSFDFFDVLAYLALFDAGC